VRTLISSGIWAVACDAPLFKAADVGIPVGTAVDVAKESADIILLKKDLKVMEDGELEGHTTHVNTMKYIMMGISSNFSKMLGCGSRRSTGPNPAP